MEEDFDVMQLAALTAAASSAANSTAYSVDAVVKEAVLFFATMPSASALRRPPNEGNEEVFKTFGRRAHADACSAAEACAEAHQHVTRQSAQHAVLAAGKVGMFAARTATIAREAAQLCMGILEEAVQANAGPLARETAKRCAEQALHSVEAAGVAEMHSCSLREKLEKIAQVSQPGVSQVSDGATVQSSLGDALRAGRTNALSTNSVDASTSKNNRRPVRKARRWWQEDGLQNPNGGALSGRSALTCSSPLVVDLPALQEATASSMKIVEHLKTSSSRCKEEAERGGANREEGDVAEDLQALRVMVDWRYGLAMARSCQEEEVLSDVDAARLATWRSPSPGGSTLTSELSQAVQRHGSATADALHSSLNFCVRDSKEAKGGTQVEKPQAIDSSRDWEAVFDGLGWVQKDQRRASGGSNGHGLVATDLVTDTSSTALPSEDGWSVDDMTLWHLHVMSMHSRHKQRRSGGAKHKEPCSSTSAAPESSSATEQDSEIALRTFLHDVLGGWEMQHEEQEFHPSQGSTAAPKRNSRKKKKIGAPPPATTPTGVSGAPGAFHAASPVHWGMDQSMRQGMHVVAEQGSQRSQLLDSNGMSLGGAYPVALGHLGGMQHSFNENNLPRDQNPAAYGHQGNQFFHAAWSNGNASKEEDPSLPLYVQVSRIPGE